MGDGTRVYDDGTEYVGNFHMGEKQGYGEITYGTRNRKEEWYKGNWHLNVRQGFVQLMLRNGNLVKGEFVSHQPNGACQILYPEGGSFSGNLKKGVPDGIGELKTNEGFGYAGNFVDGKKQGSGKFYIIDGEYTLEGEFENGEAKLQANDMLFSLVSPQPEDYEEVVADPKAKKDPKN